MSEEYKDAITKSITSALIDKSVPSDSSVKPRIVFNDINSGSIVLSTIHKELDNCSSFSFTIAFITRGGISSIHNKLKELEEKGVCGRIITTDFQVFNDPKAFEQLLKYKNLSVRVYSGNLHIKGYIFHYENGLNTILIGSSNLTQDALKKNLEWNLRITSLDNGDLLSETIAEYERIWNKSEELTPEWIEKYNVRFGEFRLERIRNNDGYNDLPIIKPFAMQQEAVDALCEMRDKGEKKAIIISATGTGKTYISAFFTREVNPKTMLFLVHREKILNDAISSYKNVLGKRNYGKFMGASKWKGDYLFASIQTMYNHLDEFDPHQFELIVCDEAHHIASGDKKVRQYKKILNYFKPKFMMGMTATPERNDCGDVYAEFDNNIAYEVRLNRALEEDLVCPFHYFGISDLTVNGVSVDEKSDFRFLASDERVKHLVKAINEFPYSGRRIKGLIFCSRVNEGQELSKKLNEKGLRTVFLEGGNKCPEEYRQECIDKLESDDTDDVFDFIITRDIFNEGVDIPSVNMIIMMRPTKSAVVFIQQLGRGLRKKENKEFLTVIDFIGNYSNNYMIPIALFGDNGANKDRVRREIFTGTKLIPGASTVDFDKISKERLFSSINSMKINVVKELGDKYKDLQIKLKRDPGLLDMYRDGCIDPRPFSEGHLNTVLSIPGKYKNSPWNLNTFRRIIGLPYEKYNEDEDRALFFLTNYLSRGIRPYEPVILKSVMEKGTVSIAEIEEKLKESFDIIADKNAIESACNLLSGGFVGGQELKKFTFRNFVLKDEKTIRIDPRFQSLLTNDKLSWMVQDVCDCCLEIFKKEYLKRYDGKLCLFSQYSRRDLCVAYNYYTNCEGTINGYQINRKDPNNMVCPIFVTYKKKEDIRAEINYADEFIDNETLSWVTQHGRKLGNKEVVTILNADKNRMKIPLFVQRNDYEDKLFYYLGTIHPIPGSEKQMKQKSEKGEMKDIVNIQFHLEQPIIDDLYRYLISN